MDKDEFDRMKSEAEQRMKEIYAGSQQEPQGKSEDTEYKPSMSPQKQENTGSGIINTLFKDKDKTVILALLLLNIHPLGLGGVPPLSIKRFRSLCSL